MEAEAGTLTQAPLLKWNAHHMVHRTNPGSKGHVYGAEVSKYDANSGMIKIRVNGAQEQLRNV